jgi:chaperonin GroEL
MQQDFQIIGIKAPGFGDNRAELMKDIAAITGTTAVGNLLPKKIDNLTAKDLGTCGEIVITPAETVITGTADVKSTLLTLMANSKSLRANTTSLVLKSVSHN